MSDDAIPVLFDTDIGSDIDDAVALTYLLPLPPVTAYLTLNFTGSTPFTSRTGVRREIFAYVPIMAWMFGIGIVLTIVLILIRVPGGSQ